MQVIIVEDEMLVSQRLKRMIGNILGDEVQSIDVATGLREAIKLAKQSANAVVLLDLNLSGQDGFDLIRRAVVEPFQTIVVSASIDRAIEAFDLGVVDFLAKPFTQDRLQRALMRVKESMAGNETPKLAVTSAGAVELVDLNTIVAIHGDGDYAKIETIDGQHFLHNKTLAVLQDLLPKHFVRVHRSHIANLNFAVRVVKDQSGQSLTFTNDTLIPIGRSYLKKLSEEFVGLR